MNYLNGIEFQRRRSLLLQVAVYKRLGKVEPDGELHYKFNSKPRLVTVPYTEIMQTYNALNTTLTAEAAVLHSDVTDAEKTVKKLETTWQDLKSEHNRIENLLEKTAEEQNCSKGNTSLKESLTEQIKVQEELAESLIEENRMINSDNGGAERQHQIWADLNTLLRVKMECLHEAKQIGAGGTLFVQKGAETFTLQ